MAHDAKQMAFREQRCKEEMFPKGYVGVMWVKTYGYIMRLKQGCWLHFRTDGLVPNTSKGFSVSIGSI